MKRNQRCDRRGVSIPEMMFKRLLNYFGMPYHTAPGEAEAECALLQQRGLVDAVLSEDVDTLMFGCTLTLRNWSSQSPRSKTPTHVSVYDASVTKATSGLDREGMILVALLSGGDYQTAGVSGFGVQVACEAARAGLGKSLCQISRGDASAYEGWREKFHVEVQTNASGFFRTKHPSLRLPLTFPPAEILAYYTHPVVSSAARIEQLRESITWSEKVDHTGLRRFVAEAFDWRSKAGTDRFIRGLAPALLVDKLRCGADRRDSGFNDVIWTAMNEMELVREICGTRAHFDTDGLPEMRVVYHPTDIVSLEESLEDDDTVEAEDDGLTGLKSPTSPRSPTKQSVYDPTLPDKVWIAETLVRVGVPLKAEDYDESLRILQTARRNVVGAMDRYVVRSQPRQSSQPSHSNQPRQSSQPIQPSSRTALDESSSTASNKHSPSATGVEARRAVIKEAVKPAVKQTSKQTSKQTFKQTSRQPSRPAKTAPAHSRDNHAHSRRDPWSLSKSDSARIVKAGVREVKRAEDQTEAVKTKIVQAGESIDTAIDLEEEDEEKTSPACPPKDLPTPVHQAPPTSPTRFPSIKPPEYIRLRTSCAGMWAEAGADEVVDGRARTWRQSGVGVVDVTDVDDAV